MIEFGIYANIMELPRLRDVAQAVEALGYDLLMFPDHLVHEREEGNYDPHALSYDSMISAAVALEATTKLRAGHLVLCNPFRHPVMTAQSMVTLDHLSAGRYIAGLGTGWAQTEFRMMGITLPDMAVRLRMLDEALTCIRSLWTQERTTFKGEFYQLKEAILWPKPVQKPHPPILIGGSSRAILRLAARHADVLNMIWEAGKQGRVTAGSAGKFDDSSYIDRIAYLREQTIACGRKPQDVRVSNLVFNVALTDSQSATGKIAAGISAALGISVEQVMRSPLSLIGTPQDCVAELQKRITQWGVTQFIFWTRNDKSIRRLAEEVLAKIETGDSFRPASGA